MKPVKLCDRVNNFFRGTRFFLQILCCFKICKKILTRKRKPWLKQTFSKSLVSPIIYFYTLKVVSKMVTYPSQNVKAYLEKFKLIVRKTIEVSEKIAIDKSKPGVTCSTGTATNCIWINQTTSQFIVEVFTFYAIFVPKALLINYFYLSAAKTKAWRQKFECLPDTMNENAFRSASRIKRFSKITFTLVIHTISTLAGITTTRSTVTRAR